MVASKNWSLQPLEAPRSSQDRASHDPWLPSSFTAELIPFVLEGATYRLWAQAVGPTSDAVTLLILSGGPGKPHTELDGIATALMQKHRLLYWDSLGSPGSDCFNPAELCTWHAQKWASLPSFVSQAQAVLLHFEATPSRTVLLGHSFGVVLALELAVRADFAGLILSDWVADQAVVTKWAQAHPCMLTVPKSAQLELDCMYIDTVPEPPPWVRYTFTLDNPGPLGNIVWGPKGIMKSWDRTHSLPYIQTPALWLVGGYDLVDPADVEACAHLMPQGRFVYLAEAGHNSFADMPEQWLGNVTAWLGTEVLHDVSMGVVATQEGAAQVVDSGRTWILGSLALLAAAFTSCRSVQRWLLPRTSIEESLLTPRGAFLA